MRKDEYCLMFYFNVFELYEQGNLKSKHILSGSIQIKLCFLFCIDNTVEEIV